MKCKNCGHKIIGFNKKWYHAVKGKKAYLPNGTKCKCGCRKPEPPADNIRKIQ